MAQVAVTVPFAAGARGEPEQRTVPGAGACGPVAVVDTRTKDAVPVGLVAPGYCGVTVAVNATCWLTADGLGVDTTLVELVALITVSLTVLAQAAGDVQLEKFVSPLA